MACSKVPSASKLICPQWQLPLYFICNDLQLTAFQIPTATGTPAATLAAVSTSQVGGNLPCVSPAVLDHCAAVAVGQVGRLLQRSGTGLQGPSIGFVGIRDVDVQECARCAARAAVADHDHRVAN